ncbi:MAG TPA: hypothetical protein VME41_03695 [Stellaceae bacterium]|nr:hypothetical protein [Stellaceae bacterium]
MSSEAAPRPEARFKLAAADASRKGFWVVVVGSVDALLRAFHGIREYTDDPVCVFRLGLVAARDTITLSDGTAVGEGEPVGTLHLWNEHLPPYKNGAPDLAWASEMRRRVFRSLQLLAEFADRDPIWQKVRVFRGDATLSRRLGETQIRRLAERHGFERIEAPVSVLGQLHFIGDCFNAWALTRAFNPAALERQGFLRGRCEVWISRRGLLARYGRQPRPRGGTPEGRAN